MSDIRGGSMVCNNSCGCPSPCPGGQACRCMSKETSSGGDHMRCSCGDHCGCNPCTCAKSVTSTGTGKAFCKCGEGCTCVTCGS